MATHNAPKHDFAPAWLKIPNQENPKPSGPKQTDNSDKNSYKRHSGGSSGKYRHHSLEDEYYPYPYNHYGYSYGYGMQYGSQPSMFRSPGRDPKYPQHPGLRYQQQMNGGYPGYYDLYQFDYYHGDPYYAGYPPNRASSKRSHYEREGRTNSKEGKEKEVDKEKSKVKDDDKDKIFQDDFPSLNGEDGIDKSSGSKITNGGSVWENPPHGKIGMSKFGDRSSNMYKALVPNKGNISRKPNKDALRLNGGFPKETFSSNKTLLSPTNTTGPNKEGSRQSPTPPIEILNPRLVTQSRNLVDKKSEFLKALRKSNSAGDANLDDSHQNSHWNKKDFDDGNLEMLDNGLDELHLGKENGHLSSSLEAEQRLLREMGWNEADEEYEITEDDKRKFQDLYSKKAPQQKEASRVLQSKALSPKHIPLFYRPMEPEQLNDTLSSSDSEDDTVH